MADSGKVITEIQVQKRDPDRVSIFLDGEYSFGLPARLAESLSVGMKLSIKEITSLQMRAQEQKAMQLSWDQLSRRPRTEKEIRDYLRVKNFSEEVVDTVIQKLAQMDYVDDAAFAAQWIENRQAFRPRGRLALKVELQQKGVSKEVITSALMDFDDIEAAYAAAKTAWRKYRNKDPETFQKRVYGYLSRRGFNYETIRAAVEKLDMEQNMNHHSSDFTD